MIGQQSVSQVITLSKLPSLRLVLGTLVVLALALVNLEAYPATWFDEGQYLHVPKALLQHGVYADWSSEGPRYYGPTTAAGPTVLLPIAGAFWIGGIGLLQARLVMVGYLLVSLGFCYLVAARTYGRTTALVASGLLLGSRGAATLLWGRQVLGEVPVLTFVLAGLFFWQGALTRQCGRRALAAGICWGLALVTKNQAVIAFAPAIVLIAMLEWRYYRNGRWSLWMLPPLVAAVIAGAWLSMLFTLLGPGELTQNIALTRKAAGGAILVLTPEAIGRALKFLISPQLYGGLLLPAIIYRGCRVWKRRDARAQVEAAILVIIVLWLAWYVCSLGWPRYAYIGAALGALPVAQMLTDLIQVARQRQRLRLALAASLITVMLIAVPLAQTTFEMLAPDRSVLRFAAYLDDAIPHDTLIATWEPELGGLTDHRYQYPPQALLDVAVRHQWSGTPPARLDLEQHPAPYVVIGPFGAWTGVYPPEQVQKYYTEAQRIGSYVLYRRVR